MVTGIQEANSRLLLAHRVLHPREMQRDSPYVCDSLRKGDIYMDGIMLMTICQLCSPPPP